jgi:hypothetical protein
MTSQYTINTDYMERQEQLLCGKHALNNLFGCELIINDINQLNNKIINNKLNIAYICSHKNEYSDYMPEDDPLWADCDLEKGNYSAQFIGAIMLELKNMKIISEFTGPLYNTQLSIENNLIGYLINLRNKTDIGNHWVSIKIEQDINKCNSKLIFYDSLETKPICITNNDFQLIISKYDEPPVFFKIYKNIIKLPSITNTNIIELLSKVNKKHSYFYAKQSENEIPFNLDINLDDTKLQATYDATYQPLTNVHMEQRKLLLSQIQLLNEYYKTYNTNNSKIPLLIYVGSAPGIHLLYLHKMFPNVKFVLYDNAKFFDKLKTIKDINNNNVFEIHDNEYIRDIFTNEVASELKYDLTKYDILFVSDIRVSADTNDEFEQNIMDDMRKQEEWVRIIKPTLSLLKFRFPFNAKDNISYINGKLLYSIWRSPKSSESILLIHQNEINENKEYNVQLYENNLFFNNKYTRPFAFRKAFDDFSKYIIDNNYYCPCYDCYSELTILKEYETIMNKMSMDNIINMLLPFSKDKFWSKTWDENIALEDQLEVIEKEPNSIIGLRRHIPIQDKNILIVIPKVNIYMLDNFETLFDEYINSFQNSLKTIEFDNMCYYKIVILDSIPYKEQLYYGAILNSAYTIAKYSSYKFSSILFHEPFLRPNRKMLELYLSDNIKDDIIFYSNIYKSSHPLSIFAIKTDILYDINGFPNNVWDPYTCYNVCLDRIKQSNYTINYVINNEIESNSIFFNIAYTDDISDKRPLNLVSQLNNTEINNFNIIREKSNYDNWCGLKQRYYFNTEQIINYYDNIGQATDIQKYTISLHNSCSLYTDIDINGKIIDNIDDLNRDIIDFMINRISKYIPDEKYNKIDNIIVLEYLTTDTFLGMNLNYSEFIESILNILEDTYLYIRLLKSNDEHIQSIIDLIIKKWYSYIKIVDLNKQPIEQLLDRVNDPRIVVIEILDIQKLLHDNIDSVSVIKLKQIYEYSQDIMDKYIIRSLFYNYNDETIKVIKFMLQYYKYTYLHLIVHNLNINKVIKNINDLEATI